MPQNTDPNGVQVIDNFLPNYQFRPLKRLLLGSDFSWYFQETVVHDSKEEGKHLPQFTYTFFRRVDGWTDRHREVILPLIDKLDPFTLVRIKANLTVAHSKNVLSGFHTDFARHDLTTSIFYVSSTNGPTFFEGGSKVDCVENRMVIFPSNLYHSGSFCTDQQKRVVINFNFIK